MSLPQGEFVPDARRDTGAIALTPEIVAYLAQAGVEVAAGAGDVLVRRGEPGRGFWAVLEGTVEVRLTGDDGVHLLAGAPWRRLDLRGNGAHHKNGESGG